MEQTVHHLLYRITCLVTSKYYIGIHSTKNTEDGYMGSGLLIGRSLRKHGVANHRFEVLERHLNRESLVLREIEVISEELLSDPLCLNIRPGGIGGGGWDRVNNDPILKRKAQERSQSVQARLRATDQEWCSRSQAILKKALESAREKAHTPEAVAKMKRTISERDRTRPRQGPQYDICWVNKGGEILKINKSELESYLSQGYSRGWGSRVPKYTRHTGTENYQKENNSQFGTCWITKDGSDKKIKKLELEAYLALGYRRGRSNGYVSLEEFRGLAQPG